MGRQQQRAPHAHTQGSRTAPARRSGDARNHAGHLGRTGCAGVPPQSAADQHRWPSRQQRVSGVAAGRGHRGALHQCTAARTAHARPAGAREHLERSAGGQPAGGHRHRSRTGLVTRGDRHANRKRAVQRVRLTPGQHHLHAGEPVPGHSRAQGRVPEGSGRPRSAVHPQQYRQPRAARRGGHLHQGRGAGVGAAQRTAARRVHLVQHAPRCGTRYRRRCRAA